VIFEISIAYKQNMYGQLCYHLTVKLYGPRRRCNLKLTFLHN